MKWYSWVIIFFVLSMISVVAFFTPLFTNLSWYWWVIIALVSIIVAVASYCLWAVNQCVSFAGSLLGGLFVKPWLQGNFGKREK